MNEISDRTFTAKAWPYKNRKSNVTKPNCETSRATNATPGASTCLWTWKARPSCGRKRERRLPDAEANGPTWEIRRWKPAEVEHTE